MEVDKVSRRGFLKSAAAFSALPFLPPSSLLPENSKNKLAPKETDIFDSPLDVVDRFRNHSYLKGTKLQKQINEILGDGEEAKKNREYYEKGYKLFAPQIKEIYEGAKNIYKNESPNGLGALEKIHDFYIFHRHLFAMQYVINSTTRPDRFVDYIARDMKILTKMFAPIVKNPNDGAAARAEYDFRANESMNNSKVFEGLSPRVLELVDKVKERVPRAFCNVAKIEESGYNLAFFVDDRHAVRLVVDPKNPDLAFGELLSGLALPHYPGWTGAYPDLSFSHPQDLLDLGRISLNMSKVFESYYKTGDVIDIAQARLLEPEGKTIVGRTRYISSENAEGYREMFLKLGESMENLSFSSKKNVPELELIINEKYGGKDSPFFIYGGDLVKYLNARDNILDIQDSIREEDHIRASDLMNISPKSMEKFARLVKEINDPSLKVAIEEDEINIENINGTLLEILSLNENIMGLASMKLGFNSDSYGFQMCWYEGLLNDDVYSLMQPLGLSNFYSVGPVGFTLQYGMKEYAEKIHAEAQRVRDARNTYALNKFGKRIFDNNSVKVQEAFMASNIMAIKALLRIMGVEKGGEEVALTSLSANRHE